jgi:glycine/serine hydroxymethyltransferase
MGMGEAKRIGAWIDDVVTHHEDEAVLTRIAAEVKEMCSQFPAPGLPIG